MAYEVAQVHAIEILDSRGRPTLEVSLELASGLRAVAGVPSGASTGTREAVESQSLYDAPVLSEFVLRIVLTAMGLSPPRAGVTTVH